MSNANTLDDETQLGKSIHNESTPSKQDESLDEIEDFRKKTLKLFRNLMSRYYIRGMTKKDVKEISRLVELACYEKVSNGRIGDLVFRYSSECYKHSSNLNKDSIDKNSSSSSIYMNNLYNKYVNRENDEQFILYISNITSDEINPQFKLDKKKTILNRLNQKEKEKYTNKNPCRNCKSTRVVMFSMHKPSTSADEISSFRYECKDCGKYWTT